MKTSLVALLLALSAVASGQDAAPAQRNRSAAQPAAQRRPLPHSPRSRRKKSRIPPNTTPTSAPCSRPIPTAKISGLEAFLTQYPNSVMKEDALELLMGTYQQAGNQAKVIDTANRLLAVNPNNTRALVLLAYNERAAQKWADAKQHAERGLQALDQDDQAGRRFRRRFRQTEGPTRRLAEQRRRLLRAADERLRVGAEISAAGGRSRSQQRRERLSSGACPI